MNEELTFVFVLNGVRFTGELAVEVFMRFRAQLFQQARALHHGFLFDMDPGDCA